MQTTLVKVSGKGSNPKTVLYVGGLEESVTELSLRAAFVPFGPIKECNIPLDNETGKHRGFGFVEYEDREDAADAIDNMHNGELFGRHVTDVCAPQRCDALPHKQSRIQLFQASYRAARPGFRAELIATAQPCYPR
jgi:RNA recognition motif-containing protein